LAFFFEAIPELEQAIEFGFVFPSYRRRGAAEIRRVPTARASIYYAANVVTGPGAAPVTGMFCEGPHSRAFTVTSESGELVGVKVAPGGLRALLAIPARKMRDHTIPLEQLWGKPAIELGERMQAAASTAERVALLQHALAVRWRAAGEHPVAVTVARMIEECAGRTTVRELCERAGYGQRSMLQRFDDGVGLTPKQCIRLARLRAAIVRVAERPGGDGAELAVACGYCDQAHMIHEFRDLVGVPPAAFRKDPSRFSPLGAPAHGREALPNREQRIYRTVGMVSRWLGHSDEGATR
jgi:AraC-like DNA-binding protein